MIDWAALKAANAPLNAFADWDDSAAPDEGPLDDLAIGVKSNIAVRGLPWTAGMGLYRDRIAARDAEAVARLRAAGAAILGTLNMHEAALGATTDNPWFGRTYNPHGEGRTPGGSSGGSGAAVAAGLCDAALGTDTLGSVRIPAAYNGVYGLKPTSGAVPDDGLESLHRGFDAIGPLARSLTVLERVWDALSTPLPGRVSGRSGSQPDLNDAGRRSPDTGLGVGGSRGNTAGRPTPSPSLVQGGEFLVLGDLGGVACEPAVLKGYRKALAALPNVTALTLPPLSRIRTAGFVEAARELSETLGPDRNSDLLSPDLRWLLDYGDAATRDTALLDEVRATLVEALGENGVLILPTAPQAAFVHGSRAPSNQADFTCLANIAGLPALALPAGRDADIMPVGVQIVGPAGSEAMLFEIARTLDVAF